jgi:hypothetical protein
MSSHWLRWGLLNQLGWPPSTILPLSASQVVRVTDTNHHTWHDWITEEFKSPFFAVLPFLPDFFLLMVVHGTQDLAYAGQCTAT